MWRKADWNMCTPALRSGTGKRAKEADVYWVQRCVSVNVESLGVLALGAAFPAAFKGNSVLTVKVCFVFKLAYRRMCRLFLFVMHQAGQVSCVVVPPPFHNDQRG